MSQASLKTSTLTDEEKSLLTRIVDKDIREITPSISAEGIVYKGLTDITEDYDWRKLRRLLNSLSDKEFLVAKETDRALLCPKCGAIHVFSKYTCPNCQSTEVIRVELIEHPFCGYTGIKKNFILGSSLICPSCKTNLGSLDKRPLGNGSKEDYRIIGSSFECEKCGNRFNKPNVLHICKECVAIFDYKIARYEKIFNYEIPEQVIKIMRSPGECTILLIEDNPDDAKIITRYLTKSRELYRIEHASSGEEGLEKAMNKYFDVILLDYKLPDMNGIEIMEESKKRNIHIPIIMLTGADDRKIAVEAMKLGAADYIVKSLDSYKKLPSVIKQIINK